MVLSPEYLNEAISYLVVQTFLKRFLFSETQRVCYAESSRTAPILSFTLCTPKTFLAVTVALKVLVLTKEELDSACVYT